MSSLPEEVGTTIRTAIKQWPQTLRLMAILATVTIPTTMIVLAVELYR